MDLSLFLQSVIDHSDLRMFTEFVLGDEHVQLDLNNSASKRFASFVITPHLRTNTKYYEIINNNDKLISVSTNYHAYIDTKHYDLHCEDKILKVSTSKGNFSFDASNYNKIQLVKKNETIYDLLINFQTKSIKGNSKMTIYLSNQQRVKLSNSNPDYVPNENLEGKTFYVDVFEYKQVKGTLYAYKNGRGRTTNYVIMYINETLFYNSSAISPTKDVDNNVQIVLQLSKIVRTFNITKFPAIVPIKLRAEALDENGAMVTGDFHPYKIILDSTASLKFSEVKLSKSDLFKGNDKSISVSGSYEYSGKGTVSLNCWLDEQIIDKYDDFRRDGSGNKFSITFSIPDNLSHGNHELKLRISDNNIVNISNPLSFNYIFNTPKLSIKEPSNKATVIKNFYLSITFEYSDLNEDTPLFYSFDNGVFNKSTTFSLQTQDSPSSIKVDFPIGDDLDHGDHILHCCLNDSYNMRSNIVKYTFTVIDPTIFAPTLTNIASTKENYTNKKDIVEIKGQVSYEINDVKINVSLLVNGIARNSTIVEIKSNDPVQFKLLYTNDCKDLIEGDNQVTIEAKENVGKKAAHQIGFKFIYNAPELNIHNEVKTFYKNYGSNEYNIQYNIYDLDGPSDINIFFKIDNSSQICSYKTESSDKPPKEFDKNLIIQIPQNLTVGDHIIIMWANDSIHESDHKTVKFTFNTFKPELDFLKYPPADLEVYENFKMDIKLNIFNHPCNVILNYSIGNYHNTNPPFFANRWDIIKSVDILLPINMHGKHEISFQVYDENQYSEVKKLTINLKYPLPSIALDNLKKYDIVPKENLTSLVAFNYTDNINEDKNYNLTYYIDDQNPKSLGNFAVGTNSMIANISIPYELELGHHNISFIACNIDHHRCNRSNYIYFNYDYPPPPTDSVFVYKIRRYGRHIIY